MSKFTSSRFQSITALNSQLLRGSPWVTPWVGWISLTYWYCSNHWEIFSDLVSWIKHFEILLTRNWRFHVHEIGHFMYMKLRVSCTWNHMNYVGKITSVFMFLDDRLCVAPATNNDLIIRTSFTVGEIQDCISYPPGCRANNQNYIFPPPLPCMTIKPSNTNLCV